MKRTPLVRRTPLKAVSGLVGARTPLRRSAGRTGAARRKPGVPPELRLLVIRRDGGCLARRVPNEKGEVTRCWGRLDPQHIWRRGQGAPNDDPAWLICLCRLHHEYADTHPRWAREHGFLVSGVSRSTRPPVPDYTRGG